MYYVFSFSTSFALRLHFAIVFRNKRKTLLLQDFLFFFFSLYFKLSFSQILYPYKIPLFPAFAVNLTLWPLSGHCPSQDMRIDVKNFNNLSTSWSACVDSCVHHFCIPLFSLIFGLQKSKKIVFYDYSVMHFLLCFIKHATSSILIVRKLT